MKDLKMTSDSKLTAIEQMAGILLSSMIFPVWSQSDEQFKIAGVALGYQSSSTILKQIFMKQIGFIIIVSISGLYAAHHIKMLHHPAHVIRHGNREMKQERKPAITFHHALGLHKAANPKNSVSALMFTDQNQMEESDNIISNQMNEEMAIANLSFVNSSQLRASDAIIQDQFSGPTEFHSNPYQAASADAGITENFYSEN